MDVQHDRAALRKQHSELLARAAALPADEWGPLLEEDQPAGSD